MGDGVVHKLELDGLRLKRLWHRHLSPLEHAFMPAQKGTDFRLDQSRQVRIDVDFADIVRDGRGSLVFVRFSPCPESLLPNMTYQGLSLFTAVVVDANAEAVQPRHAKHHVACTG